MFSLIRKLLNGFTSMTSDASEKKEVKMIEFKTNIPALDKENAVLFKASALLEKLGNVPGLSANERRAKWIQKSSKPSLLPPSLLKQ